jgi:hypothetical protein
MSIICPRHSVWQNIEIGITYLDPGGTIGDAGKNQETIKYLLIGMLGHN